MYQERIYTKNKKSHLITNSLRKSSDKQSSCHQLFKKIKDDNLIDFKVDNGNLELWRKVIIWRK